MRGIGHGGRRVARRRLRHKLMLGLVLVAAIIGLLAVGTFYGLYTYYTSVKTTNRKLGELEVVTRMMQALGGIDQGKANDYESFILHLENTKNHLNGPYGFRE